MVALCFLFMALPGSYLIAYNGIARVTAGMYLIIQIILVIDFMYKVC